jgi:hypothetical protein
MDTNLSEERIISNFIDITCEYSHFYTLPLKRVVNQGEKLEFTGLGACTICLSSNFHARPTSNVKII